MTNLAPTGLRVRPSWGQRLAGIEGLRGIAALSVVVYHVSDVLAPKAADAGAMQIVSLMGQGLTLFFVLSGFLLFRPFAYAMISGTRQPRLRQFYENRALRIWPAYLVVFIVVNYFLAASRLPGAGESATNVDLGVLDAGTTVANAFMVQTFFPGTLRTGLEVAWTLSTELSFYLILPLLAQLGVLAMRRGVSAIKAASIPIVILLVTGTVTKAFFALTTDGMNDFDANAFEWGDQWSAVLARSILTHADLFAYGMAAALAFALLESGTMSAQWMRRYCWASYIAAVAVLLVAVRFHAYADTAVALVAAAVVLHATTPSRSGSVSLFGKILEAPAWRFYGLISYSLYLWHLPLIRLLKDKGLVMPDTAFGFLANVAIIVALSTVLAALTYHGVEKQALRLKRRTGSPARKSV